MSKSEAGQRGQEESEQTGFARFENKRSEGNFVSEALPVSYQFN
jgi:hypothetical protein